MSRALTAVEAEQAELGSACAVARAAAEKAEADVRDAEARVLATTTAADPKLLEKAEAALRQAEAVRASTRRRI